MPIYGLVPAFALIAAVAMAGGAEDTSVRRHVVPEAPEESASVTLEGDVMRERHYGPPNYGETPEEDRIEEAVILSLLAPLCTPTVPEEGCEARHIHDSLQLVIDWKRIKGVPKTGCIIVSGPLFRSHTGHHRRAILMSVKRLEPCGQ